MSILKLLGFGVKTDAPKRSATAQRICDQLASVPDGDAEFLAGFAYILGRVAKADWKICDDEVALMRQSVARIAELSPERAALVVDIAVDQALQHGATEDYLVTREFRQNSTRDQRLRLLHCMYAVSAADDNICANEDAVITQIARELGLDDAERIAVRLQFSDKLSVLKAEIS